MILVLLIVYLAVLAIAIKFKLIKPTLFWKISPLLWVVFLLVALFIPLQFWAPGGYIRVIAPTVQIVPNVSGQVINVSVKPNQHVSKGDILYQLDARPFQSVVDRLQADLTLANIRFEQQEELQQKNLGRKLDIDRTRANVASTQAQLDKAQYDLEQATVRAPDSGIVTNVEALQEGARVVSAPFAQTLAFVEDNNRPIFAQIQQSYLRYVEIGQSAEIAFKMYPGQVFPATVKAILPGSSLGQFGPSGILPTTLSEVHGPMFVRLYLTDTAMAASLPAGATGDVAIYTEKGSASHVIRKVMIRTTAITNYVNPF
jgi:Multidrug resistance efflux pump